MPRPKNLSEKTEFEILNLIHDGQDRSFISRNLDIDNTTLGRWLNNFEFKEDYVKRIPKYRPFKYELKYKGRQRLSSLRNLIMQSDHDIMKSHKILYSLDQYSIKYSIIKEGEIFTPNEHQMNNWLMKIDTWKDCTIKQNSNKSIELKPMALIGDDPARLLIRARAICDSIVKLLENQFGFILGFEGINNDFVIELSDDMTKSLYKEYGYVRGIIDRSKLEGELNFRGRDPDKVLDEVTDWRNTPKELSSLKEELKLMNEKMEMITISIADLIKIFRMATELSKSDNKANEDNTGDMFG